jgi:hypothetical protein
VRPVLARTAAVRGGAVVGLRRFGGQHATDRFAFTWTGGIDPERSAACRKSSPCCLQRGAACARLQARDPTSQPQAAEHGSRIVPNPSGTPRLSLSASLQHQFDSTVRLVARKSASGNKIRLSLASRMRATWARMRSRVDAVPSRDELIWKVPNRSVRCKVIASTQS